LQTDSIYAAIGNIVKKTAKGKPFGGVIIFLT